MMMGAGKQGRALWLAALALMVSGIAMRATAQSGGDNPGNKDGGASGSTGAQVYTEICKGCHMANAQGATGAAAIPALAHNPHLADPNFVIGRLTKGKGGMPAFGSMLDARQIAAVATYVRTHYGNNYKAPVTAPQVQKAISGGKPGS